jgi:hypothetical protein
MNIIAKHLDRNNLALKIQVGNFRCAFSGMAITEAVKKTDLIKDTFTDHHLLKYESNFVSIDYAMLLESVIHGKTRLNSMRNYSFYADNNQLNFLSRDVILDLLFNIPEIPFRIGVTYNNKKHIAIKSKLNTDRDEFQIITDFGEVIFNKSKVLEYLDLIKKWYTIIPGKENTEAKPTFFTKEDIKGNTIPNFQKIKTYGISNYFADNEIIQQYRNTSLFNLMVHLINKKHEN